MRCANDWKERGNGVEGGLDGWVDGWVDVDGVNRGDLYAWVWVPSPGLQQIRGRRYLRRS